MTSRVLLVGALCLGCSRAPQELASVDPPPAHAASTAPVIASTPVIEEAPLNYVQTVETTEPWNPKAIAWQPFEQGLALAKKEKKPVCLVLFTTWCGHCKNYSHIFGDPRLVLRAKQFVMIRVDADANDSVSKRYQSDGTYVPRTFFLDENGTVDPKAHSDHPRYKHFFDENHADSLLEAMNDALTK